jgi:hypothetical protein
MVCKIRGVGSIKNALTIKACSVLLGATVMTTSLSAHADVCADANARGALEMRVLQSELMVAALTCGQRQNYNSFVSTFKSYLKNQGENLRVFYDNSYGESGTARLNRLVTRLANQASSRTLNQSTSKFCAQAKARFETILTAPPRQLAYLAQTSPRAGSHGFKSCVEVANRSLSQPDQN